MNREYSHGQNRQTTNLAFALAHELQQYIEANAAQFDNDTWDNISYWRAGVLSQGAITEENLSEIIKYIGAEKLQELIVIASSKTTT